MESKKIELKHQMEEKGITMEQAAEAMAFNPQLLGLYLAEDSYPVPPRILDKLAAVVNA